MQPGVKQSTVKYTQLHALPNLPPVQASGSQLSTNGPQASAVSARMIVHGTSVVPYNKGSDSEEDSNHEAEMNGKIYAIF